MYEKNVSSITSGVIILVTTEWDELVIIACKLNTENVPFIGALDTCPENEALSQYQSLPGSHYSLLLLRARKRAFSAPRICTVEAGYLARLVRDPA